MTSSSADDVNQTRVQTCQAFLPELKEDQAGARPAAPPPRRALRRPPARGAAHGGARGAGQERAKSEGGQQLLEATARVTKLATKVMLIAAAIGAAQMGVALLPTLLLPHWFSADPAVQVPRLPPPVREGFSCCQQRECTVGTRVGATVGRGRRGASDSLPPRPARSGKGPWRPPRRAAACSKVSKVALSRPVLPPLLARRATQRLTAARAASI